MEELKSLLPLLKVGAKKQIIPLYASFMHSQDGVLSTYNNDIYMSFNKDLGFEGDVNIFLFDAVVAKQDDQFEITKDGDEIHITNDGHHSKLLTMDTGFPVKEQPICDMVQLDETFVRNVLLASKYIAPEGMGLKSYVCVDEEGMYAYSSDYEPIFHATHNLPFSEPIGLSKTVVATLSAGCKVGIYDKNVVVQYGELGFGIFTCHNMDSYPREDVYKLVIEGKRGAHGIGFVSEIKESIDTVMPIFYGEKQNIVSLENEITSDGPVLTVLGASMYNGESRSKLFNACGEKFRMLLKVLYVKNVPDPFSVGYRPLGNTGELICVNEDKTILIKGEAV